MSKDLERVVREKSVEMKGNARKMEEFKKDDSKIGDASLAHYVKLEKTKMKADGQIMQEFKK